jgi:predicted phage-related endonuclease
MQELRKIIKEFVEIHKHLAVQGSKEWLLERVATIGGSEIAAVLGKNKYMNLQNFFAQKIGLTTFIGNTATRWGNLFEGVTEVYIKELLLVDQIYSTGSVPNKLVPSHKYSPDGISIVKIKNKYYIVLLEFKAPFSSIPDGTIPVHYLPQVKSGLCTIDITQKAIFVSNVYRKCTMAQLKQIGYDTLFHKDKIIFEDHVVSGIILFYIESSNLDLYNDFVNYDPSCALDSDSDNDSDNLIASDAEYTSDEEIKLEFEQMNLLQKMSYNVDLFESNEFNSEKYKLIDLGNSGSREMIDFLELFKPADDRESFLSVKYIKPNFNQFKNVQNSEDLDFIHASDYLKTRRLPRFNFEKTVTKFKKTCLENDRVPVAVLPWKLYRSDMIVVEKDTDYLQDNLDKLQYAEKILKDFAGLRIEEKIEKFTKMYPKNKVVEKYNNSQPLFSKQELSEMR